MHTNDNIHRILLIEAAFGFLLFNILDLYEVNM